MPDEPVVDPSTSGGQSTTPTPTWRDSLPPELKSNESLGKFNDVAGIAKSYIELEKLTGDSIRLPKDTSKPEEWDKLYNRLGRPEKPDGYQFERPKDAKVPWDEDLEKEARGFLHKLGINQNQAKELLGFWSGQVEKLHEKVTTSVQQGVEGLRKQHGEKLDDVIKGCQEMVSQFCTPEELKELDSTGRGNEPWFINMMHRISLDYNESGDHRGGAPGETGMTVDEARAKIAAIRNDKNHAYHSSDRPGHKEALDEMAKLYQSAVAAAIDERL